MDTSFNFFFSSRRRHTRFDCDWSSDVCSSDLVENAEHADDGSGIDRFAEGFVVEADVASGDGRSEEHTSELQSQSNLVCRLLLEKKTSILNSEWLSNGSSVLYRSIGIASSLSA